MTRRILIEDLVEFRKKQKHGGLFSYLINHPSSSFVDSGGYRQVYESMGDSEDYVIKWNRGDDKFANREDAENFSSGSPLFPKLLGHSEDYEWIAVEKVQRFKPGGEFFEQAIISTFPAFSKLPGFLRTHGFEHIGEDLHNNFDSKKTTLVESAFIGMLGNPHFFFTCSGDYEEPSFTTFTISLIGFNPHIFKKYYHDPEKYFYGGFEKFYNEIMKNKELLCHLKKLYNYISQSKEVKEYLDMLRDFKPDSGELTPNNLGYIPAENRIVIIDSQKRF